MSLTIGIDLGTTNSAVACMKNGRPVIVPHLRGEALTRSVLVFGGGGGISVGRHVHSPTAAVVWSVKREMGSSNPVRIGTQTYLPVEISAMILGKLRSDAEARIGKPLNEAVVTVPAYFNDHQRRATRDAAALAGLTVRRLVNEPTAAALAYGLDMEQAHTVLVWDLGGGTFDVSILELGDGVFKVKAVNGNTRLGGDDYDERLAEMLADEFRRQHRVRLGEDPLSARLLRELAERAKIELSGRSETRVELSGHSPGRKGPSVTIARDAFETVTAEITDRMIAPAKQVLADARLDPLDLDRVVLVGGMSRVPAVRRLVRQITGLQPYAHIDPDRVVALGAAVQAGVLAGRVRQVTLVDVTPLSLGIETEGGLFGRIIER